MLAIKPKNFHSAASETKITFLWSKWLASPGFTEQEYEQEPRFSQILETAGFSAGFHLQDFLSFLGKVIPQ